MFSISYCFESVILPTTCLKVCSMCFLGDIYHSVFREAFILYAYRFFPRNGYFSNACFVESVFIYFFQSSGKNDCFEGLASGEWVRPNDFKPIREINSLEILAAAERRMLYTLDGWRQSHLLQAIPIWKIEDTYGLNTFIKHKMAELGLRLDVFANRNRAVPQSAGNGQYLVDMLKLANNI